MNIEQKKNKEMLGLIEVLCDKKARIDERDDAAMDLGDYDDDQTINALATVGSDLNEDRIIVNSCGSSLAEIWIHRNRFDKSVYDKLVPEAKSEAYGFISEKKTEWIKQYNL